MEDKFQQLYDYMSSSGLLVEGTTPESFRSSYVSGEKDISKLYKGISINESLPFETGDLSKFSQDFFGVEKKKRSTFRPVRPKRELSLGLSFGSTFYGCFLSFKSNGRTREWRFGFQHRTNV